MNGTLKIFWIIFALFMCGCSLRYSVKLNIQNMSSEEYCFLVQKYEFPKDRESNVLSVDGNSRAEVRLRAYNASYIDYWKCDDPEQKTSSHSFGVGDAIFADASPPEFTITIDELEKVEILQTHPKYCFEDLGQECDPQATSE
ncbi:MAG: hypothetical protein HKN36_09135 [Hellea sp.]|nr:hypothetical protein [Hellea sp.]